MSEKPNIKFYFCYNRDFLTILRKQKPQRTGVAFFQNMAASAVRLKTIRHKTRRIHLKRGNGTKVVCAAEKGDGGVKGCGERSLLRFPARPPGLFNFSSPFSTSRTLLLLFLNYSLPNCHQSTTDCFMQTSFGFYLDVTIFPDVFMKVFFFFCHFQRIPIH